MRAFLTFSRSIREMSERSRRSLASEFERLIATVAPPEGASTLGHHF